MDYNLRSFDTSQLDSGDPHAGRSCMYENVLTLLYLSIKDKSLVGCHNKVYIRKPNELKLM